MLSPELEALLSRIDRVQKLVWTVLTLSIVLYGAVAFAVAGSREGSELAFRVHVEHLGAVTSRVDLRRW